jgi:hypothetical protein
VTIGAAIGLAAVTAMPALADTALQGTPRQAAKSYLDALARGDAQQLCRLLSPQLRREVVHEESARSCPAAVRPIPRALGHVPIVSVRTTGNTAFVVLGDAQYSDSGNDNITLRRVHGRWMLTSM